MIAAIEWLKANWKGLGYPLAAVFCLLWLTKKPEPLTIPPQTVVNQNQGATEKIVNRTVTKFVPQYVYVPGEAPKALPCPAIEVTTDMGVESTHWQSQAVTITPDLAPSKPVGQSVLFLGLGYLDGPTASAGYGYGPWRANVQGGFGKVGGGLTLDVIKF
jgi:hypothetical protein